jgi:hypothetical protein
MKGKFCSSIDRKHIFAQLFTKSCAKNHYLSANSGTTIQNLMRITNFLIENGSQEKRRREEE